MPVQKIDQTNNVLSLVSIPPPFFYTLRFQSNAFTDKVILQILQTNLEVNFFPFWLI